MRQTLVLSHAAAAALLAGGAAYAQSDTPDDARPALTRTAVEQRTAAAFARMDANGDGVLDPADRAARVQQVFARIDADGNGAISPGEFAAKGDERREARAERRGGPGGPRFAGRGMLGRAGPDMARAADTDRNGAITQAEFAAAALARFERADADHDGTVSRDERRDMRREWRERRGERERG